MGKHSVADPGNRSIVCLQFYRCNHCPTWPRFIIHLGGSLISLPIHKVIRLQLAIVLQLIGPVVGTGYSLSHSQIYQACVSMKEYAPGWYNDFPNSYTLRIHRRNPSTALLIILFTDMTLYSRTDRKVK